MKKIFTLIMLALVFTFNGVKAQNEFRMSEVSPYVDAYMEPFAAAMAVGMSGGWAHTAEVHKTLGFDISFSGSVVSVPSTALTFDAEALNMPTMEVAGNPNGDPTISAPNTLMGPSLGKTLTTPVGSGTVYFPAFKGLGLNKGGNVALQAAIGLPKGFEIMGRFVPDFSSSVNSALGSDDIQLSATSMWGIGLKHDIKQWIPVVEKIPFLQLSAMFNYSSFKSGFGGKALLLDPEAFGAEDNTGDASQWENQSFDFKMSSFSGSLLVGASIPIFQPFIGIGFNSASFDGGFKGSFPVIAISSTTGDLEVNESEEDPLPVDFSGTDFNFQAGARLKFGFFVLHYAYTIQTYSMHTAGLAFTFR